MKFVSLNTITYIWWYSIMKYRDHTLQTQPAGRRVWISRHFRIHRWRDAGRVTRVIGEPPGYQSLPSVPEQERERDSRHENVRASVRVRERLSTLRVLSCATQHSVHGRFSCVIVRPQPLCAVIFDFLLWFLWFEYDTSHPTRGMCCALVISNYIFTLCSPSGYVRLHQL